MKAFVSYSHKDQKYRERLGVHLRPLERSGLISVWYDRKLHAGDNIDESIDENLADSDLFIAIVSPDYLASYYCFEKEMDAAFKRHSEGKMQIVSIIVEPCIWHETPLGSLKALPEDGKPVSEWSNPNNAYLDVMRELRRLLATETASTKRLASTIDASTIDNGQKNGARGTAAPKYRTKKSFSKIDEIKYVRSSFDLIRAKISEWCDEINQVDGIQAHFENMEKDRFYVAIVNRDRGNRTAEKTVFLQNNSYGFGAICTVDQRSKESSAMSGGFSVESDDYELYLEETMSFGSKSRLSAEDAASVLWDSLITRAEIDRV